MFLLDHNQLYNLYKFECRKCFRSDYLCIYIVSIIFDSINIITLHYLYIDRINSKIIAKKLCFTIRPYTVPISLVARNYLKVQKSYR